MSIIDQFQCVLDRANELRDEIYALDIDDSRIDEAYGDMEAVCEVLGAALKRAKTTTEDNDR